MIELTIPQAGEETKTAKDLVFSILSEKQPLKIIEIARIIKREYHVGLTYQAIKKAIDSMEKNKLLLKEGKQYNINKNWLINLKTTIDNLLTTHDTKKENRLFSTEFTTEQYAVYTFSTLLDLDNFWDDMLIYLSDHLNKDEKKSFVAQVNYCWWLLINLGKEIKVFEHLRKKKFVSYNLFVKNVPLNKWAEKIYEGLDMKFKIKKLDLSEDLDMNIIGDTIIQIKYPKEILSKIKSFYEKYKTTQEMSLKEITQLVHEPCEIKFIVFKNRDIAMSMREKYLKNFK